MCIIIQISIIIYLDMESYLYFRSNYNDLEQLDEKHLTVVIKKLIETEVECNFLDFKREVHGNNAEFLKDIISLANNTEEKDSFLILGVDDKTKKIFNIDMVKYEEHVNNILTGNRKKFAGESIPNVHVRNILIEEKNIKIIIIKNSIKAPFYLIEECKDKKKNKDKVVKPYEIYTRYGSSNTVASTPDVEKLWAKHFGINKTSLEKFLHLNNNGWKFVNKNSNNYAKKYIFNENNPEYTIRFLEAKGMKNYPYSHKLNIFNNYELNYKGKMQLFYHSVKIFEDTYYFAKDCEYKEDNQRYYPKYKKILNAGMKYYLLDTIQGKLIRILNNGKLNFYNGRPEIEYGHYLVFYHENDFRDFIKFIIDHLNINIQPSNEYNFINPLRVYLNDVFTSEDYVRSINNYITTTKESNFVSLPSNFQRLIKEKSYLLSESSQNWKIYKIMEKAYMFTLYLKWREIKEDEYNEYIENMI